MITVEHVNDALNSLEKGLEFDDDVLKASEQDLDQPEGSDMGGKMVKDKKMSDDAPGPDKSKKAKKSFNEDVEKGKKKQKSDMKKMDEMDEEEGDEMEKMYHKKSFADDMPEEIQTKIDVSEFLKSLVDHTGETIDSLREYVAKSDIAQESRYDELNEAVEDIQKSQAKIGVVLKAICERIGVIETAPAHAPKTDRVAKSTAQVAEREFNDASQEEQPEKMFKSLSENPQVAKSQISESLCDLVRKGEATDLDVIGFESGGYIRPELVTKLKTVMN